MKNGTQTTIWLELEYRRTSRGSTITEQLFIKVVGSSGSTTRKFIEQFAAEGKDHLDVRTAIKKSGLNIEPTDVERVTRLEGEKLSRFKRLFERDTSIMNQCVKHELM